MPPKKLQQHGDKKRKFEKPMLEAPAEKKHKSAQGTVTKQQPSKRSKLSDSEGEEDEEFNDPFLDSDNDDDNEQNDTMQDDGDDIADEIDLDKLQFVEEEDMDGFKVPEESEEQFLQRAYKNEDIVDALADEENEEKSREEYEQDQFFAQKNKAFVPPKQPFIAKNYTEELEFSNDAYQCLHRLRTEWPVLSFDFIRDNLGYERTTYPYSLYCVAGVQAKDDMDPHNGFYVMKMTDLFKTYYDSESEGDDDDETVDIPSKVDDVFIQTKGSVNRIRSMPQLSSIVACWTSKGLVQIYDIASSLTYLDTKTENVNASKLGVIKCSYNVHKTEGFALDWSPFQAGLFASGDCAGKIMLLQAESMNPFSINQNKQNPNGPKLLEGHKESVEDIQWSPTEATVFASASCDRTVGIWDIRKCKMVLQVPVSNTSDINVISWNQVQSHLFATGDDEGVLRIYDLRMIHKAERYVTKNGAQAVKTPPPVALLDYHKHAITSVQWHYKESSILASTSEDNTSVVWDLSVEPDDEQHKKELEEEIDVPPQMLFMHQGQKNMKEVRWHPQIPNLCGTASLEGIYMWKAACLEEDAEEILARGDEHV